MGMELKSIFFRTYANLPLGVRNEIVAVVDSEPITWNVAKLEIEQDTEKGKQVLEMLFKLGILQKK